MAEQELYEVGSFRVEDEPRIFFPVVSIQDSQGNRIVQHERPYRAGAKLDSTGAKAREWSINIIWNNTLNERGLSSNGRPLFPDVLRALQRAADVQATGDLVIPGLGNVRARLSTLVTRESADELDTATSDAVFVQDNEEALDRTLIRAPTARATARRLAENTVFSAESVGAWGVDLNTLTDFAAELEGALQEPGRAINKVDTQVRRNRRAIARVVAAGNQALDDVEGVFSTPRGSSTERLLLLLSDRQAASADERASSLPRTVPFVVDVQQTNIFEIASRVNQDPQDLLDLNDARIADPISLRRGDTILVFQATPRL